MIDFNAMEETNIENFRGGQGVAAVKMVSDEHTRIMKGRLATGCSIGMHCHDTSLEVVYILSGTGKVIVDGEEKILPSGTCHYCRQGQTHSLMNEQPEDLIFFAVIPQQG